jgi:hypothetical protein
LPREAARSRQKAAPSPTVRLLLQDVAEGIRVLQTRDGVELTDAQILERARNIVTGLLGNYRIRSIESREAPPREAREPRAEQMNFLDEIEARAEARNNGRPGRAARRLFSVGAPSESAGMLVQETPAPADF